MRTGGLHGLHIDGGLFVLVGQFVALQIEELGAVEAGRVGAGQRRRRGRILGRRGELPREVIRQAIDRYQLNDVNAGASGEVGGDS